MNFKKWFLPTLILCWTVHKFEREPAGRGDISPGSADTNLAEASVREQLSLWCHKGVDFNTLLSNTVMGGHELLLAKPLYVFTYHTSTKFRHMRLI